VSREYTGGVRPLHQPRLRRHDRLNLELEVTHPAPSVTAPSVECCLEIWLLMPAALKRLTASQRLYEQLHIETRLQTPLIGMADLCRVDGIGSPLGVLHALCEQLGPAPLSAASQRTIRQEARLLAFTLRSAARAPREAALYGTQSAAAIQESACEFAARSRMLLESYRRIRAVLEDGGLDEATRRCLRYCDEYLSAQLSLATLRLMAVLEGAGIDSGSAREALSAVLAGEEAVRRAQGWAPPPGPTPDPLGDTRFLRRVRLLSRYAARPLRLIDERSQVTVIAEQVALMAASALAMAWAAGLQIFAMYVLHLELSSQDFGLGIVSLFVVVAVVGYILKDRIKATVGAALTRRLPRWIDDRRHILRVRETPIGAVQERARRVGIEEIPLPLRQLRTDVWLSSLQEDAELDVLRYRRRVTMKPRVAVECFPRFDGIKEHFYLNIWPWTRELPPSRKRVLVFDPSTGLAQRGIQQQHQVELLIQYTVRSGGKLAHQHHGRSVILLSRRGIISVDGVADSGEREEHEDGEEDQDD
jgi:hypothetical protein